MEEILFLPPQVDFLVRFVYLQHEIARLQVSMSGAEDWDVLEALERLFVIAGGDSGQARRVADFLLAWHCAEENGGWDPADLWAVDNAIADDMLAVVRLIRQSGGRYPNDLGFGTEITAVWRQWRAHRPRPGSALEHQP